MTNHDLSADDRQWHASLVRRYVLYAFGFLVLIGLLAAFEVAGMAREWIGYVFLLATVLLYAAIGIYCRTSDPVEYYVAGRRVPAVFNGMATESDRFAPGAMPMPPTWAANASET